MTLPNTPRPFNDIQFNFKVSLTLEDAVLALLGWPFDREPFRELTEDEQQRSWESIQEGICEDDSLSLYEVLRDIKITADGAYNEAKSEDPENHELLKDCLNEIQNTHNLIVSAYRHYSEIVNELAKGPLSLIRVDNFTHPASSKTYITWESLESWASTHKISLYNRSTPTKTTFQQLNIDVGEVSDRVHGNKTVNAKDLLVTLANLALRYADTPKFQKSGGINRHQFFNEIFDKYENPKGHSCFGKQTVNDRLKQAFQTKSGDFDGHIGPTENTNLQHLVAVLAIKYAEKSKIEQDHQYRWVKTIAEHIQDASLEAQDTQSIAKRLEKAHRSL